MTLTRLTSIGNPLSYKGRPLQIRATCLCESVGEVLAGFHREGGRGTLHQPPPSAPRPPRILRDFVKIL